MGDYVKVKAVDFGEEGDAERTAVRTAAGE